MKIMYFVHGTTYDNASGKCSGWSDVKLNDLGKDQAINLGKIVPNDFDIVFTSDLSRAVESANLAFPKSKKIIDKRLRECNYGNLDGKEKKSVIYNEHINEPFPNGESLKDVEARMKEFLEYIKQEYPSKNIAIVAHRAPQLAIEVITKNISWEDAIKNDWRKIGNWNPGWEYEIK